MKVIYCPLNEWDCPYYSNKGVDNLSPLWYNKSKKGDVIMNYKEMSKGELLTALTEIRMELDGRFEAEKREAIKDFEKAFTKLREYTEVYVSDDHCIYDFDEFEFE